jgi:Spy/CpxP family protein refolding chaperone
MLGFIVGTASLYGLYRMRRGSARLSLINFSPQSLQRVFHRLDTTPAQERVILEALEEARQGTQSLRKEAEMTKEDIIVMFKSEEVEVDALGAAFARQDEALTDARLGATQALAKIHNALTEEQRVRLSRLLNGSWF